jgi:hypothetical protein
VRLHTPPLIRAGLHAVGGPGEGMTIDLTLESEWRIENRPLGWRPIPASVDAPYSFSEAMALCVVENEQRGNRCEAKRPERFLIVFCHFLLERK